MYPARYQLPALTRHLVALLERRRAGLAEWNDEAERLLRAEAAAAIDEAGRQFKELADDPAYWERVARLLETVMLPHYLKLAREQQALEARKFGAWRGGDFLSRVVYAAAGLAVAIVVWRSPIPDWLEPLPLAFFVGGPLLPDLQTWWGRRSHRRRLEALVGEMEGEQAQMHTYQSLQAVEPMEASKFSAVSPKKERA